MTDTKFSDLAALSALADTDEIPVASSGASKKISVANLKRSLVGADGWIDANETWTYASGSGGGTATLTISGDVTAKYSKGTRLKLTQTTVKYFVVIGASYNGGTTTTTVTLTGGSDYTLANAAITANYYSYMGSPQGYPGWFNYDVSGATGFTGSLSVVQARFAINGRVLTLSIDFGGTSNATSFTFPVPATASGRTLKPCIVVDNGSTVATGRADLPDGSSTITVGKSVTAAGGFTASGSKSVFLDLAYLI